MFRSFEVFGITFYMYGLMIGIGLIMCFTVLRFCSKKACMTPKFEEFVELNGVLAIVTGFFGAALFQAVYDYIENPSAGFHITQSITFIGGLIVGVIVFLLGYYFYGRKKHGPQIFKLLQFAPCCIIIAHAFGRIGCFFSGCCFGKPVSDKFSWLGVIFPGGNAGAAYPDTKIYPTQLFEAAFLFILFGVILFLFLKKNFKYGFSVYVSCYGVFRFFNETLRDDHRGNFIGSLSPSQFWSIIMILLAVPLYFLMKRLFELNKDKVFTDKKVIKDDEVTTDQ